MSMRLWMRVHAILSFLQETTSTSPLKHLAYPLAHSTQRHGQSTRAILTLQEARRNKTITNKDLLSKPLFFFNNVFEIFWLF